MRQLLDSCSVSIAIRHCRPRDGGRRKLDGQFAATPVAQTVPARSLCSHPYWLMADRGEILANFVGITGADEVTAARHRLSGHAVALPIVPSC